MEIVLIFLKNLNNSKIKILHEPSAKQVILLKTRKVKI